MSESLNFQQQIGIEKMNTTDAGFADFRAELMKDSSVLDQATAEAKARYNQARYLKNAPVEKIDAEWNVFKRRFFEAARKANGSNANSEIDWLSRTEQLSIAREAIANFLAYTTIGDREMRALSKQSRDDFMRAIIWRNTTPQTVTTVTPGFDAALAVQQFAARGITLSVGVGGVLQASPAGMLADAERTTLKAHSVALIAFLGTSEVIS